ncbi:S1 RNA-binding domain-containing protein [Streptomyces sp. NPDC087897]|uniref:S1 RNA-binding domain-containing protein n=1 Tax=Streptomyces sp. NPDC087897 TaxID=3365817 RepID=UPI00382DDB39
MPWWWAWTSSPGARNSGRSCPLGVFVDIGDEAAGLVPFREIDGRPAASRAEDCEAGERIAVVVAYIDTPNRRVVLSMSERVPYAGLVPPTWRLRTPDRRGERGRGDPADADRAHRRDNPATDRGVAQCRSLRPPPAAVEEFVKRARLKCAGGSELTFSHGFS